MRGFAFIVLFCAISFARADPLTIVMMPLPGGLVDESGRGVMADLFRQTFADEASPPKIWTVPAKRALITFDSKQADVAVSIPLCRWHQAIYLPFGIKDREVFFARSGETLPAQGGDLGGKRIAVVRGFTHLYRARESRLHWIDANDYDEAFHMMRAGIADYVYGYAFLASSVLKRMRLEADYHFDPALMFDSTTPTIVFHDDARGFEQAKTMQKKLEQFVKSGAYEKLMLQYSMPAWYFSDGKKGQFPISTEADCKPLTP